MAQNSLGVGLDNMPCLEYWETERVCANSRHTRSSDLMVRELRKLLSSILHGEVTLELKISGFCSKLAQAIRGRFKRTLSLYCALSWKARKKSVGSPTRENCCFQAHCRAIMAIYNDHISTAQHRPAIN